MDREDNWDDYIILQAYVATAVHALPYVYCYDGQCYAYANFPYVPSSVFYPSFTARASVASCFSDFWCESIYVTHTTIHRVYIPMHIVHILCIVLKKRRLEAIVCRCASTLIKCVDVYLARTHVTCLVAFLALQPYLIEEPSVVGFQGVWQSEDALYARHRHLLHIFIQTKTAIVLHTRACF